MAIIVVAKGLRYTLTLMDTKLKIKQNAGVKDSVLNLVKKCNFLKKEKYLLLDIVYPIKQIKKVSYSNPTQDTSVLKIELNDEVAKSLRDNTNRY